MNNFIRELGLYRHLLPKQTIKTIRGQALGGDLEGAKRGLKNTLRKNYQNHYNILKKSHENVKFVKRKYPDIHYTTQLGVYIKYNNKIIKNAVNRAI